MTHDSSEVQTKVCAGLPPATFVEMAENIKVAEGFSPRLKADNKGYVIGYGQNFTKRDISPAMAEMLLIDDLNNLASELARKLNPLWDHLGYNQQAALVELAYQMGIPNLMKFENTLNSLAKGDAKGIIEHVKDSKWYRVDTGSSRSARVIEWLSDTVV